MLIPYSSHRVPTMSSTEPHRIPGTWQVSTVLYSCIGQIAEYLLYTGLVRGCVQEKPREGHRDTEKEGREVGPRSGLGSLQF